MSPPRPLRFTSRPFARGAGGDRISSVKQVKIDESWYRKPEAIKERAAAGGIVVRHEGDNLYVAFAREWDFPGYVLPKGGVDPGESDEQAARREIAEEIGISELELLGDLGVRERLNFQKKRWVRTHYFLYKTAQVEGEPLDKRKHYTGATWFRLDALPEILWPEQKELIVGNRERIIEAMRT
jgi:8-oxo-dGTP pyrophosphatase MutT (NUDIX family)